MAYYWTCPECGSNNDLGEQCDCQAEKGKEAAPLARKRPQAQLPTTIIPTENRAVKRELEGCRCQTA